MFKPNRTLLPLLCLSILGSGLASAEEAIPVSQFSETNQALHFRKLEIPGVGYYIPKSHAEVKCVQAVPSIPHWACTVSLLRTGLPPSSLAPNTVFYPYTPDSECRLLANSSDSGVIASVKSNAVLKIRAQGMTPAGDSGALCSFEMGLRGEQAQVEAVLQTLRQQAEAGQLIDSPVKVVLNEVLPVGDLLQTYLAKDLELDPSQNLTRGEASFLLGIASGRVSTTSERLSAIPNAERAAFYRRAVAGLFVESASGLRLQSQSINRMSVAFEQLHSFQL